MGSVMEWIHLRARLSMRRTKGLNWRKYFHLTINVMAAANSPLVEE